MADEPRYSNRQIERMLDQQSIDLKIHIDKATNPILVQTSKTNGRVTKLERIVLVLGALLAGLYLSRPDLAKVIISLIV